MQNPADVQLATLALQAAIPVNAQKPLAIILGTGLDCNQGLLDQEIASIPFSSLPGFVIPEGASHPGRFVYGHIGEQPIIIQQGRCHLYEGASPAQICMSVRVMAALGCQRLIITNAAGSLNPLFNAGSLMCLSDMINHTGISPLTGPNHAAWGDRFPDMSCPFAPWLRKLAMEQALQAGIKLEQGIYIGVHGPEMETPAETRMFRQWGADAIGMSTVLEVIAARHLNLDVLGISCLTNKNLPDCMPPTSLDTIIEQARKAMPDLTTLLRAVALALTVNA